MIRQGGIEWTVLESRGNTILGGMLQWGTRLLEDAEPLAPGAQRVYMRERTLVLSLLWSTWQIVQRTSARLPISDPEWRK